jgi:exopolysaccharide biosynthesis predicted pyruvyltransferase EpsI
LPEGHILDALTRMGAKYLPTIKDQKASQRFQTKTHPLPFFKKSNRVSSVKKDKQPPADR